MIAKYGTQWLFKKTGHFWIECSTTEYTARIRDTLLVQSIVLECNNNSTELFRYETVNLEMSGFSWYRFVISLQYMFRNPMFSKKLAICNFFDLRLCLDYTHQRKKIGKIVIDWSIVYVLYIWNKVRNWATSVNFIPPSIVCISSECIRSCCTSISRVS
jgi:hypothetical protein